MGHEKTAALLVSAKSRGLSVDLDEAAFAVVSAAGDADHKDRTDVPPLKSSSQVRAASTSRTVPPVIVGNHHKPAETTSSSVSSSIKEQVVSSSSSALNMTTLPSSLSATMTTATGATTTFSMELLNKDGRIGIYLPEARKARIARFHA